MHLKNMVYTTVSRSIELYKQIAKPNITPLEKREFLHVLIGLKQGLKVQGKELEEYLVFTAK